MKKVAVLGAGVMGAGIAQVAAQGGYSVILRDLQISLAQEGLKTIEKNLEKMIAEGFIDFKVKNDIINRITPTTDLAQIYDADLVIEAVVENIAVKKQIFAELDNRCKEHTILATNTSSLSITEIASATKRPEKVVGMHFFNPVSAIKLVEIVKGMETDERTVEIASQFVEKIGKEKVVINRESPGFIVNRILIPYINEAIFIYGEGLAEKEEIDLAMKLGAGMPIGPLELADIIGLDTLYSVIISFYNEFRDTKYRPHPLLATMVRAGYLGKKSGRGFYVYNFNTGGETKK
ncbi:3-hydroxyacyl-CoA dehydrogenase NAD-binding domain-containing protein [Thermosyntropha sp.]|uniref:3-hydroxyacyl-CoA dehydrogenase family protein n=1 Tax=Thermosyntropha sp. TaxID=2740820 RepID=UPI002600D346|nr:3-hydroxyacyl-CoA dehydrogenase NAD-binding domain-containing protein [Thermosyntropha sp.]MBO8158423.1 3-hydroxybutyryl-CoA dehydrogenase [Thermosyntropha sp.]